MVNGSSAPGTCINGVQQTVREAYSAVYSITSKMFVHACADPPAQHLGPGAGCSYAADASGGCAALGDALAWLWHCSHQH
jgi:hypothetical protein